MFIVLIDDNQHFQVLDRDKICQKNCFECDIALAIIIIIVTIMMILREVLADP